MENKIINSPTIDDFLLSKKGNESLYFLLKYMKSNAEIRRKRVNGLIINYNNVVNFSNNKLKQEDKNLKNVVKRIFAIEIINQTLMSIEDLAAFCLFFIKFPLEDIPSKIIGYKTKDLENFYLKKWKDEELIRLQLFPGLDDFANDKELLNMIRIIQTQNTESLKFYFQKILEYRNFYGKLHNKNKHGNTIIYDSFCSKEPNEIDKEDTEVVLILDSVDNPFDLVKGCIVGKNTINKSYLLLRKVTDILVTLIDRRNDYFIYESNYPPRYVFGENPLSEKDWNDYISKINSLLPIPRNISISIPTMDCNVSDQERWLHAKDWNSKWFSQKKWEYKAGSKKIKPY